MRILVTADTHGPRHRLPAWLVAAARAADLVLHAGDVCDRETLQGLAKAAPTYAVRGNRDLRLALPERLLLGCEGISIGIVHGHMGPGGDTTERARRSFLPSPDVIVFGHSHRYLLEQRGQLWLANPGSPTRPRDGGPSAILLDVSSAAVAWRRIGPDGPSGA